MVAEYIRNVDHWIAFVLLAGVGANMVRNGLQTTEEHIGKNLSATTILITAIATNIDAVAIGIGLAFVENINILQVCLAVALGTLAAVYLGLHFGKRTGKMLGQRAEIIGGAVLILLGFKVLLSHLLG
ncbi:MAG: hypothetical protein DI585_05475 [Pseudomonas fluorescens]|nr:MAG: hypothetical protein DI585_05475 [Pseudomonas fluorescens]